MEYSHSSGPTSSMPGNVKQLNLGDMDCDTHKGVSAVVRITGEVDSMGAEYMFFCQQCYDEFKKAEESLSHAGTCEWCGSEANVVIPTRDPDEGSAGPVYDVCKPCRKKQSDRIAEECASLPELPVYDPDEVLEDDDEEF